MRGARQDIVIGCVGLALAGLALAWWIPVDTETGLVVRERRSVQVGDALAPTIAAIGIAVTSLATLVGALFSRGTAPALESIDAGERSSGLLLPALIVAASLILMTLTGPLLVKSLNAAGFGIGSYRALIATPPWKYAGFVAGGTVMVSGLIACIEGRLSRNALFIAIGTVAALIVLYDLPFDTLLLPPNGDQ